MKIENTVLITTVTSFRPRDQHRGKTSLEYYIAIPTSASSQRESEKSTSGSKNRVRWAAATVPNKCIPCPRIRWGMLQPPFLQMHNSLALSALITSFLARDIAHGRLLA